MESKILIGAAFGFGAAVSLISLIVKIRAEAELHKKIDELFVHVEQLKHDVEEIRMCSQRGSPRNLSTWEQLSSSATVDGPLEFSSKEYNAKLAESCSSDENEEFYDFTGEEINLNSNSDTSTATSRKSLADGAVEDSVTVNSNVETFKKWLEKFDALLDDVSTDKQLLKSEILEGEKLSGQSADILWRKAKVTHLLTTTADKDTKKSLSFEAFDYATLALAKDESNPECHKWYAITIGSLSEFVGNKEKIENGHEFKEHVDIAIKLNPSDATLHHMLGRWAMNVAALSWVEKKIASTLFGEIPSASYSDALGHFKVAYELRPSWIENICFVVEVLILTKKYTEAIEWAQKGLDTPSKCKDDEIAKQKISRLIEKYKR